MKVGEPFQFEEDIIGLRLRFAGGNRRGLLKRRYRFGFVSLCVFGSRRRIVPRLRGRGRTTLVRYDAQCAHSNQPALTYKGK